MTPFFLDAIVHNKHYYCKFLCKSYNYKVPFKNNAAKLGDDNFMFSSRYQTTDSY